jgi:hypothetical protein
MDHTTTHLQAVQLASRRMQPIDLPLDHLPSNSEQQQRLVEM